MNDGLKSDEENVEVLDENTNGVTNGSVAKENVVEATGDLNNNSVDNKQGDNNKKKGSKKPILIAIIVVLVLAIVGVCGYMVYTRYFVEEKSTTVKSAVKKSQYRLSGNGLEDFDLRFLQLENEAKNKIYSPLSIKYALAMLQEGASGDTKEQITNLIGDYKPKAYPNSDHMSFANAMFIRNTFKDKVREEYTKNLKDKYNAEVILDEFSSPDNINNWVSDKTFKLINNLIDDVSESNFFLINALAIDMNWNNQLQCKEGRTIPCMPYFVKYQHEKYTDSVKEIYDNFEKVKFNGKDVDAAVIGASINKYDIIKELGEDNIRKTVGAELQAYIDKGGEMCGETYESWMDNYIKTLGENYKRVDQSTDFYLTESDDVKVFAKDLKEYDGITLQYVGIMPKKVELDEYVKNIDSKNINELINGLKNISFENFKDGVVTKIHGNIPFFKYEYSLPLLKDLKKMGINNIFDINKSDLSNMITGEKQYIDKAVHKANIEFSNDGIKAAAATAFGGSGAAGCYIDFDHEYEVPIEEIDLTFDKPYMYIIRDKATGEVWFTGTVYDPVTE